MNNEQVTDEGAKEIAKESPDESKRSFAARSNQSHDHPRNPVTEYAR